MKAKVCYVPCEIGSSLKLTYSGLDDITEASESGEVPFDSFLRYFDISQTETQGEINVFTISRQYPKAGHELQKKQNRDHVNIAADGMKMHGANISLVLAAAGRVAHRLKSALCERFSEFSLDVYTNMKWFDPQYWIDDNKVYGNVQITYLYNHFKLPLWFDLKKSLSEWKAFKVFVREMYPCNITALSLWKNMLCNRKAEYPNLCLIACVVLCISGSNSTVERAFSLLTLMPSDRRLSSSHKLVEDLMLIK